MTIEADFIVLQEFRKTKHAHVDDYRDGETRVSQAQLCDDGLSVFEETENYMGPAETEVSAVEMYSDSLPLTKE